MEKWRSQEAWKIINNNYRRFTSPSFRAAFRQITEDEVSMILNIPRGRASLYVDSYLNFLNPSPQSYWEDRKPELPLDDEYARQVQIMAKLFAERLNMSEEAYVASLPSFSPFPSKSSPFDYFKGRPLIVESRIGWKEQAKLSGVNSQFSGIVKVEDWDKDPQKFTIPENPYTTWVSMSSKTDCNVVLARNGLRTEFRGGNILEGISYWNVYPHIAKGGLFSLPGSKVRRFYRAEDFVIKEHENEGFVYLNCPEYPSYGENAVLRSWGGEGAICHTFISTRDIRT